MAHSGHQAGGYNAIFFTGIAETPVYLYVDNKGAELRDAAHLWGKDSKALIRKTVSLEASIGELVGMGQFAQIGVSVIDRFRDKR